MGALLKGKYWLMLTVLALLAYSCEKEPRKVDINDGNENPSVRSLKIEVTHRYSYTADSMLPGVAITLYETEDDLLLNHYTRSDTTDQGGKATFLHMDAGTFIVILNHETLGRKQQQIIITNETVTSYEAYSY